MINDEIVRWYTNLSEENRTKFDDAASFMWDSIAKMRVIADDEYDEDVEDFLNELNNTATFLDVLLKDLSSEYEENEWDGTEGYM